MKVYLRNIIVELPLGLIQGWKRERWQGMWIVFCANVLKFVPGKINTSSNRLTTASEAGNYQDNFIRGELRKKEVEDILSQSGGRVVELGVNIGVTTCWWLSFHPQVFVTGIDMMQESIDHTTKKVGEMGKAGRWQGICAAAGNESKTLTISFENPLEGSNSVTSQKGRHQREVRVEKLDDLCRDLERVTLLKVDIEGAGGEALEGAEQLLARTDWVVMETHGREETHRASRALQKAGLVLDEIVGRMMWWKH